MRSRYIFFKFDLSNGSSWSRLAVNARFTMFLGLLVGVATLLLQGCSVNVADEAGAQPSSADDTASRQPSRPKHHLPPSPTKPLRMKKKPSKPKIAECSGK